MKDPNKKAISVLNDLIQTCRDGENGFQKAAEEAKDNGLKSIFRRYSHQRAEFAQELESYVASLGASPKDRGSAAGSLHRGWMEVKTAMTKYDDPAIISECERGEDVAKAAYEKALKEDLPPALQAVIRSQYQQVLEAHDHMRNLEVKTH